MPELPEVQTVVDSLQPLVGHRIAHVQLRRADILDPPMIDLPTLLIGRTIASINRRAKRIVFALDDANRFYIHLGMSGQLTIEPPATPLRPHTHLVIEITHEGAAKHPFVPPCPEGRLAAREVTPASPATGASVPSFSLRFRDPRRFGGIWWLGVDHPPDARLGPEPLTLRPAQLAKLFSRTRRPIKSALLDQTLIAGLGNIYVDEALFRAQLHPLTPANRLSLEQVARLNRAIKHTLRRAIRHGGSTLRDYIQVNGASGRFQNLHQVYGRESHPCPRCRTPIVRIVVAARSTHFCPRCQKY
jgi:formamidopyrimidine-DNA glycosylase